MRVFINLFNSLIQPEHLFYSWEEFKRDKGLKEDILLFEKNLESEIFKLYRELKTETYKHSGYESFYISDPKLRHIHKATVKDRVVHHAIMHTLYPLYDKTFIDNSFSCRVGKGTHKGVLALKNMIIKASKNNTRMVYILKCDVEKFFDSVNHQVLLEILHEKTPETKLMELFKEIIDSYSPGLPLGNLTSQLFANVYMNKLDQFVKNELRIKGYMRYADDIVLLHSNKQVVEECLIKIKGFLENKLFLTIHPDKIILKRYSGGIDYLGYINFPHFRILRTKTKKRMFRRVNDKNYTSYDGILQHCRSNKLQSLLAEKIKSSQADSTKKIESSYEESLWTAL